mmetsp:Transcript_60666/g.108213  ORF Transcript_60666/g.108213 Transcript_60666/m.108213 type:complete len:250 (-) Transcript_60666:82-831(-)
MTVRLSLGSRSNLITAVNKYKSAAYRCSLRTVKKESFKVSDIRVSVSKRTNAASCSAAPVNSASTAGSVALNRTICRLSGQRRKMSEICDANPISNNLSASSNTMYSICLSLIFVSSKMCNRRPGVATMRSGLVLISANWSSRLNPPANKDTLKLVSLPSCLKNRTVCNASSRVGVRIRPRAPTLGECWYNLCKQGMRNAPVLPEPVRAMATTSRPCKRSGMVFFWMGVGTVYPVFMIPLSTSFLRPRA